MALHEYLREIVYPLTDRALLLAMIVFYLLGKLAGAAGLLGIWLIIVILPAFFRYLMAILNARVAGRSVEPPGIEMFNWIAGAWTLMPLALLVAMGWGTLELNDRFGPAVALPVAAVLLTLYPASMALLATTHSALNSVNPLAIGTLIGIVGPSYLIVPGTITLLAGLVYYFGQAGLPRVVIELAEVYLFFLTFSLTGAVVSQSEVADFVQNPDPVEPDPDTIEAREEAERVAILDHAYGLISRGNRDGGFKHIQDYVDASPTGPDDYRWFFEEMLRWEQTDPALFFAQRYLRHLLDEQNSTAALKLLSRCLLENPRFRPLPEDRARALEMARANDRDDLIRQLDG